MQSHSETWSRPALLRVNHPKSFGPAARAEAVALGFEPVEPGETGFGVRGSMLDAIRLNRWLRTAHSVLYPVAAFTARNLRQFQELLHAFPWEKWLRTDCLLCIECHADSNLIRDFRIVNQSAKDAIVDRLRDVHGVRPDSGPDPDQAVVFIHWLGAHVQVYINTSGRSLSHRGYRTSLVDAPLRETLAAACVLRSGWTPDQPLVNAMCGSGTLAIEAALLGLGWPPRVEGRTYGYQFLAGYTPEMETAAERPPATPVPGLPRILCTDIDRGALGVAKLAARKAGVEKCMEFDVCDFRDTVLPSTPGVILLNPPYGERLGTGQDLSPLYRDIGLWLREKAPGWKAFVLTGNPEAALHIKLKTCLVESLFNGTLACKFLGFEIRPRPVETPALPEDVPPPASV
jgi:23S rRNA G2445 N2-methylase RlmL